MTQQLYIDEVNLGYPVADGMANAIVRTFEGPQGKVVVATQPPKDECEGLTITQAEKELLACLVHRIPGTWTFIEHYNRASHGLDYYDPTFHQVEFQVDSSRRVTVKGNVLLGYSSVAQLTGLTISEVLGL